MRTVAIGIQVVSSAILQMSFIIYLSHLGGAFAVAKYSYSLSLATVLALFIFADTKSLVLRAPIAGKHPEYDWYVAISILISVVMVLVSCLMMDAFAAVVFYLRIIQSVNEYQMACCLKEEKYKAVVLDSFFRLIFPFLLYLVVLASSIGIDAFRFLFIIALMFTMISYQIIGRLLSRAMQYLRSLTNQHIQLYRSAILPMGFTAAINMLPPYLLRDGVLTSFGANSLADFSISYQMLFSGVPVIAIFGQKILIDNFNIRKILVGGFLGVVFVFLLVFLVSYFLLINNLLGLRNLLFDDVLSISTVDFWAMAIFAILMYVISYVGYIFIKMNMLKLQMGLNLVFCLSVAVVMYFFSHNSLASLVLSVALVLFVRLLFSMAAISRKINVCGS